MKRYKYLVSTNLSSRRVAADAVEITANGELVFTIFIIDAAGSANHAVVAAAAPGYWMRFWEIDEDDNEIEERSGDDEQ